MYPAIVKDISTLSQEVLMSYSFIIRQAVCPYVPIINCYNIIVR